MFTIRPYENSDETAYLRCRMAAFLDSAYWDDVKRKKERFANPSLELVAGRTVPGETAREHDALVGILDVEKELAPGELCFERPGTRAMIWTIGVVPEARRRGLARALLEQAVRWARGEGVTHLEAWTRDDAWVRAWYEALGFKQFYSYWHVWLEGEVAKQLLTPADERLRIVSAFAHIVNEDPGFLAVAPQRRHQCVGYELAL